MIFIFFNFYRVKRVFFKTLVDEVQELEALSKDPGAVVHGKRYSYTPLHPPCHSLDLHFTFTFTFTDLMFCPYYDSSKSFDISN